MGDRDPILQDESYDDPLRDGALEFLADQFHRDRGRPPEYKELIELALHQPKFSFDPSILIDALMKDGEIACSLGKTNDPPRHKNGVKEGGRQEGLHVTHTIADHQIVVSRFINEHLVKPTGVHAPTIVMRGVIAAYELDKPDKHDKRAVHEFLAPVIRLYGALHDVGKGEHQEMENDYLSGMERREKLLGENPGITVEHNGIPLVPSPERPPTQSEFTISFLTRRGIWDELPINDNQLRLLKGQILLVETIGEFVKAWNKAGTAQKMSFPEKVAFQEDAFEIARERIGELADAAGMKGYEYEFYRLGLLLYGVDAGAYSKAAAKHTEGKGINYPLDHLFRKGADGGLVYYPEKGMYDFGTAARRPIEYLNRELATVFFKVADSK